MRKLLLTGTAVVALGLFTGAPSLASQQNGQGKNAPGGPNPVDPTASIPDALGGAAAPLAVGVGATPNGGTGVFVAVGDEGQPGSLIQESVTVGGNEGPGVIAVTYNKDYTDGDVLADLLTQVNLLAGCALVGPGCEPTPDVDAGRTNYSPQELVQDLLGGLGG